MRRSSARSPGAPGASSRRSSAPRTTPSRPTTSRRTRGPRSLIGTSPTNIGLYLLSAISAHDLGWLGTLDLTERLEATLETISRLELHRGHLYNWYDTRTLAPLEPRYVSTVDSGNLAGHLIAVRQAILALRERPLSHSESAFSGIRDTLDLVREAARGMRGPARRIAAALDAIEGTLAAPLESEGRAKRFLELSAGAGALVGAAEALLTESLVLEWARALERTIASHGRDVSISEAAAPLLMDRLAAIAARSDEVSARMDFGFLFNPARKLFAIGFDVTEGRLDANCYDLLASEARLTSFVAIARASSPPRTGSGSAAP
jgi:cyclic beta-1,2-glucan synthetase